MSLPILCLLDLSISERGALKSPPVTVDSSISPGSSLSFSLVCCDTLLLDAYTLRTIMSS